MTHVEARRTMSGLEFFQRMLAGEMPPPPMIDLLGIRLAEVEAGRVVFTATCEERFYNGTGVRTAASRRPFSTPRSAAPSTRRCRRDGASRRSS